MPVYGTMRVQCMRISSALQFLCAFTPIRKVCLMGGGCPAVPWSAGGPLHFEPITRYPRQACKQSPARKLRSHNDRAAEEDTWRPQALSGYPGKGQRAITNGFISKQKRGQCLITQLHHLPSAHNRGKGCYREI